MIDYVFQVQRFFSLGQVYEDICSKLLPVCYKNFKSRLGGGDGDRLESLITIPRPLPTVPALRARLHVT